MDIRDNVIDLDSRRVRLQPEYAAQQTLVNTAIRLAVDALYEHCAQTGWEVSTTPKTHAEPLGTTKDEVLAALTSIPNEFKRVRMFNLLTKANAFDLSLKTAGPKSMESTKRKEGTVAINGKPVSDAVRITVVSGNLDTLDMLADALHADLSRNASSVVGLEQTIEGWSMSNKGLLRKVLKDNVAGLGAEIQFIPREQARLAARITHHFFKVIRAYDDVTSSLAAAPSEVKQQIREGEGNIPVDAEEYPLAMKLATQSNRMISDYNQIAEFMNKLASDTAMNLTDMDAANKMLASMDASTQTFDEGTEAEGESTGPTHRYSRIFKTLGDIKSYRAYMKEKGTAAGAFPLPIIDHHSSPEEVSAAIGKLLRCTQLTHACYMNDAKEPIRNLWVAKAHENNNALGDNRKNTGIPDCAIDCIDHTLDPAALAQGEARGR